MDATELHEDLLQACNRFGDYFESNTKKYHYISFSPIYQNGPTCGLTALGMYCRMSPNEVESIIVQEAKNLGFTHKGEMFSTKNMGTLTEKMIEKKVEIFTGYLSCDKIIDFLLEGGIMLVPYPYKTKSTVQ